MKKIVFLSIAAILLFSCSSTDPNVDINGNGVTLKVKTYSVLNVAFTSANAIGVITSFGSSTVTAVGVCWSTSQNPTISGPHTAGTLAADSGTFTVPMTPLLANTTYYARAYATDDNGTVYGAQMAFTTLGMLSTNGNGVTDIDGETYTSVVINGKEWMKKNLDVSKYKNGDIIPQVTDVAQWDALTTGAWCYYENDTANGPIYGKLYNWYAINDPRGLAPNGWHIPTDTEWTALTTFLGGEDVAGGKLKDDAATYWTASTSTYSSNQSGFTALPGGNGYLNFHLVTGTTYTLADLFKDKTNAAYFWSATANVDLAWARNLNYLSSNVVRSGALKKSALSVRCVKN